MSLLEKHAAHYPVLTEVACERQLQDDKWGEQNHPDIWDETPEKIQTTRRYAAKVAQNFKEINDSDQPLDWANILSEEFYEAIAEEDPAKLREELIQVAAVAVAWIEAIDRR